MRLGQSRMVYLAQRLSVVGNRCGENLGYRKHNLGRGVPHTCDSKGAFCPSHPRLAREGCPHAAGCLCATEDEKRLGVRH